MFNRVLGIDKPIIKGTIDEVKALAMQSQKVTEMVLLRGTKIELSNVQYGKYFRMVVEVWIVGESSYDALKAERLAKYYDGEGARPEW